LICLALTSPAQAQDAMTAGEFDAYVTGKTITFRSQGNPAYGVERYLQNRRVMWSAFDGTCKYGAWYESKGDICFRYDDVELSQCWTMFDDGDAGLRGIYTTRPDSTVIFEVLDRKDPLICNDLSS
jgi:hypothetical protein